MQWTAIMSIALLIIAGSSVGARAHNGGHKLDEAQCAVAWKAASPNGIVISENEAEPYVVNFTILDVDGDSQISAEEFKEGCAEGLMKDPDEAINKDMPSAK